jgi:hypothetical protein
LRIHDVQSPRNATSEFTPFTPGLGPDVIGEVSMGNSVYMTPIVANDVLYIATKNMLYAIQEMPASATSLSERPDAAQ